MGWIVGLWMIFPFLVDKSWPICPAMLEHVNSPVNSLQIKLIRFIVKTSTLSSHEITHRFISLLKSSHL
jgi:hypothetical protein